MRSIALIMRSGELKVLSVYGKYPKSALIDNCFPRVKLLHLEM